MEILKEINS